MRAAIDAVRVAGTPDGPVPVVILSVDREADVVPIFVGIEEARAIAQGIDAVDTGRPMTHDLILDILEELGTRVDHVLVSSMAEGTFLAKLHLETPRGAATIDTRPSDSIALASRIGADIQVAEPVFEESRQAPEEFAELQDIREAFGR
jgi:bifunctional DNase/RNase